MTQPRAPLSVLVVDDHPIVRMGLAAVIDGAAKLCLVDAVGSGEDAIEVARRTRPDIVVMDLNLPGIGGLAAIREIVAECPHAAVLVLTMDATDAQVGEAMSAGARGYLMKGARHDEIESALCSVGAGSMVLGHDVPAPRAPWHETAGPLAQLSARELELLDLVARGESNAQISRRLFIADKTVRNHLTNIYAKLGVTRRADAVVRARNAGLGVPRA